MSVTDKVRDLLVDVDYPATKDALLAAAQKHGADDDALRALRALPPVDYGSHDEVLRSIGTRPDDLSDDPASDKARRRREHAHRGLAEHMKDIERSPIQEELGSNPGS